MMTVSRRFVLLTLSLRTIIEAVSPFRSFSIPSLIFSVLLLVHLVDVDMDVDGEHMLLED